MMCRALPFLILVFFIPVAVQAEESAESTEHGQINPQIGSIDDSGRVDRGKFEFSNIENKLWIDKHLLNIVKPTRLHYEFERTGSYEEGFVDDVYLDVFKFNEDNTRDTRLDFFSAERRQRVVPENIINITGNPVIGIYLQGDTYEMSRLTGGHWRYFLRQIKLAIAEQNESEAVTINLQNKKYSAEKIVLFPFENIDKKYRLKEFWDKQYEFIFSDDIPGKLYQIRTVINDKNNPDVPLMEEVLVLKNITLSQ